MAKSTSSLTSSSSVTSPSPSSSSSVSSSSSRGSSDRSISLKSSGTIDRRKRLAANARERKRMHLLNKAYDQLRRRLADADNKSKYDVLVQAKEYIQALASICENFDQKNAQQQQQPSLSSQNQYNLETTKSIKIQIAPMDMTYSSPTPPQEPLDQHHFASPPLTSQLHLPSHHYHAHHHHHYSHASFT